MSVNNPMQHVRQPILGIYATIISIVVSLAICSLFSELMLITWVGFVAVVATVPQVVAVLVWECQYPKCVAQRPQPLKGLFYVMVMVLGAVVFVPASLWLVGGLVFPPTPYAIMYSILAVLCSVWLIVVFQCWPLNILSQSPLVIGLGMLVLSFVVAYLCLRIFFNFDYLQGTTLYIEALDPKGLFYAWLALAFVLTTVATINALVLVDFYPLSLIGAEGSRIRTQPFFGVITAAFVLILSLLILRYFVGYQEMDVVEYLVRVPVSFIFGEFVLLTLFQVAEIDTLKQPLKGFVLLLICTVLAPLLYLIYSIASTYIVGTLASGSPSYSLQIWIASAMLGVTFPVLVIYGAFLEFWPLNHTTRARV